MRISMRRAHVLTLAILAVVLAACGMAKPMPALDSFAHTVTDGTVALYWNCSRPQPSLVRVEGWANNPYNPQPLTNLEFNLYGVNAQDSDISSAHASAQAYQIQTNEPASFTINLHTVGGEVRYDLVYHYWSSGDTGRRDAGGESRDQRNMARNICAGLAP